MKSVAIILAGGQGTRSNFDKPKQIMSLAGKPIIEHTLETFVNSGRFDFIVVVCSGITKEVVLSLKVKNKWRAVHFADAGSERWQSTLNGTIKAQNLMNSNDAKVLIHDAVRPMLSDRIINECIECLESYDCIDVAIPATDTIVEFDKQNNSIKNIPVRDNLFYGQTPQGFRLVQLRYFLETAISQNLQASDDCGLALQVNPSLKIGLVKGDVENIKLTYQSDLHYLDKLIQLKKTGIKNLTEDYELAGKTIIVIGGTKGIGAAISAELLEAGAYPICLGTSNGFEISNEKNVKDKFEQISRTSDMVFAVINCAAILDHQALDKMGSYEIGRSIDINLKGAFFCAKFSLPLLEKSSGCLINFTSSSYTRGRELYSVYSATKAGIVNMTQALSEEWAPKNVRVNAVCPQRTDTPMRRQAFGTEDPSSLLTAKEVAQQTLTLIQSNTSGQIIDIKKGMLGN